MASEIIKVILADDLLLDASEKEVADIIINIQTFIESGIMLLGSNEILVTRMQMDLLSINLTREQHNVSNTPKPQECYCVC